MATTAIRSSRLFEEVQASGRLPTPPCVVLRLLELSRKPDVSATELANTISLDPGLSAKILRFVNSPVAGLRRKVTSLTQAVSLMGARSVKMMALSFSAIHRNERLACKGFDHERFAIQSLGCALTAKRLAEELNIGGTHEAFIAGLLSQIGRSIFATTFPDDYAGVLAQARIAPLDLPPLEEARFGETYATLGGHVLRSWLLPDELCDAVETFRSKTIPEHGNPLPKLLRVAETGAAALCSAFDKGPTDLGLFLECCETELDLDRERTGSMLGVIAGELDVYRAVFELPAGKARPVTEIEAEVREQLAELSIAMHLENQSMAQQQADLLKRATTDALTGVGNRAAFDARLNLEIERAARTKASLALLILDVDRFKPINDTHGHLAGDEMLKIIARTLDENIRKVDYCARYGGEEFAIIAPATPYDGVLQVAERLRQSVESLGIVWEGRRVPVTVSIGVAYAESLTSANETAHEMIRTADRRLYEAKCAGRNRVTAGAWPDAA